MPNTSPTASKPVNVAVVGLGFMGVTHLRAYLDNPAARIVAVCDVNRVPVNGVLPGVAGNIKKSDDIHLGSHVKTFSDLKEMLLDLEIEAVDLCTPTPLHPEQVMASLKAGKHVLCEKPLSDTLDDARAMAETARRAPTIARLGFTFWRTPGIAYIRELVRSGVLGKVLHFSGRYWTDYGCSPRAPISWRYKGGPGSGALADVGSHLAYIAEFICGAMTSIGGGRLSTVIGDRPKPLGHVTGHEHVEVSDQYEKVENDDYAAFSAEFENGAGALEVSRVAAGHPNGLVFEVFCENGAARFDQERPAEIELFLSEGDSAQNGYRQVILGPEHPYLAGGLPMDAPGVGFGQNDAFAYQARAFLEEVAGIGETSALPRCATFDEGVHNMELLEAVTKSALAGGKQVAL